MSKTSVVIKRATTSDKTQLIKLFYDSLDEYRAIKAYPTEVAPFEELADRKNFIESGYEEFITDYFVFVAYYDDQAIGYITGLIEPEKYFVLNKEGFIEDWYVYPEFRHQNVGKQLFEELVNVFKQHHVTHLGLETYWGYDEAIKRYEKMGFVKHSINFKKKL